MDHEALSIYLADSVTLAPLQARQSPAKAMAGFALQRFASDQL